MKLEVSKQEAEILLAILEEASVVPCNYGYEEEVEQVIADASAILEQLLKAES